MRYEYAAHSSQFIRDTATYKGRFLGIDFETFGAKLTALEMPINGSIDGLLEMCRNAK